MKKLNELNNEELTLVFHNNRKLQSIVFDDMMNDIAFWHGEYLDCWQHGAIDYCIGWDRGAYFSCVNKDLFLDGLKKAQKDYGFLSDDWSSKIEQCEQLYYHFLSVQDDLNDENYYRLETKVFDLFEELETACFKRFMNEYEYCFNDDNVLDYFINCYMDTRDTDDYFIDDEYTLFKHFDYIESYN